MTKVQYPTAAEIARGREIGKANHWYDGARLTYRPRQDVVELELVNSLRVAIPRKMIPVLGQLPPSVAREMRLGPWGEAIEVPSRDIHVSVSGTLRKLLGFDISSRGGQAKTPAKVAASRANGLLGGRPRVTVRKRKRMAAIRH